LGSVMRLKAIVCQVFTREMEQVVRRSPHAVEVDVAPMGLHDLGAGMRAHLQERIDAADDCGYDAILLGYALCGRGTEGLRAGKTPLVLPRAHDCIGVLMGGHPTYLTYFENHPGTYYRSPGWTEFQAQGTRLEPAFTAQKSILGERRPLEELVAQYGAENGAFLFEQFNAYRKHYSGLTYIATGVAAEDAARSRARAEAEREGWAFNEVNGTLRLLERLVCGPWDAESFLVVPPGATIQATLGDGIVDAQ
jgi:hypothetical protein